MDNLFKYWKAVQQRVCEACIDGNGAGGCLLSHAQECALKTHFPEIVKAVRSVKSKDVQPYTDAIRQGVCVSCKHQSDDGTCSMRTELDCGLDRYLLLVIEAIESVDSNQDALPSTNNTGTLYKGSAL